MGDKKNNTGLENSGYCNSGDYNSGNYNSGNCNSGDCNSGNRNSGHYNSGNYNSGHYNSGNCNSGDCNSGDCNSGNRNSGDCNSGNRNLGNYNSGSYNSGFFNTDEPTVRMFNKDTNKKQSEIQIPYCNLKITEWISELEMTDQQKINDPDFHIKGGTLIKRTYKEAWAEYWNKEASAKDKQQFLDLPNFDAAIFKEITGIDVEAKETCDGKVVEIDRKKYKLKEVK